MTSSTDGARFTSRNSATTGILRGSNFLFCRLLLSNEPWPNHALQRTAPRVIPAGRDFLLRLSTHHAGAAPHSAVAELEVVRRSLAPSVDRDRLNRYFLAVSTQQLTTEAMALPLSERVSLAQTLWQSIDVGLADTEERDAVREAIRRDQELSSGAVVGRTHEEVMQAARRAIGCA